MILDDGIAVFFRVASGSPDGNMHKETREKLFETWYGWRKVGFNRFFSAKQVNRQIDAVIRILRPESEFHADDICIIDGTSYRIAQVQGLRDDDAGEDVCDVSLERLGEKYECQSGA